MKKVDFSKIELEMIDGSMKTADFQHGENGLANQIYMQAREIKWKDLGRKIYEADGAVELNSAECEYIRNFIKGWSIVAVEGIERAMETGNDKDSSV